MSTKRDYYDVLEVSKNADKNTIKKAFRKKAMKFHPDVNKEDPKAEEKFKEVNEAYEVLSDADKKARYDRFGHQGVGGRQGGGFSGDFEEMFRGSGGFGNIFEDFFGGGNPNRPRKGQDAVYQIEISLEEAFYGIEIKAKMLDGETKPFKIPRGVKNGTEIRMVGKGHSGSNGGPNGDYYVRVFVRKQKRLERSGDDLVYTLDINILDIMSGKKIILNIFKKESVKITIPELSDLSKLLRIKGKGFINMRDPRIRGNLYIRLNPIMPRKLNKKAKSSLDSLKKELKI